MPKYKMIKRKIIKILFIVMILNLYLLSYADTIIFDSGNKIKGIVVNEDENIVEIKQYNGEGEMLVTYPRTRIKKIIKNETENKNLIIQEKKQVKMQNKQKKERKEEKYYQEERIFKKQDGLENIEKMTLFIRSDVIMGNPHGSIVKGIITFEDKNGREQAINYDGIAELSCKFFHRTFIIREEDFIVAPWPYARPILAYPIRFYMSIYQAPTLFSDPATVECKVGHLVDTCVLKPGTYRKDDGGPYHNNR